jgi:RHS repeat-associated protein
MQAYDLNGTVSYFDGNGNPITSSSVGNRFLFTGAILLPEANLYDMRNRVYFPRWGRFLQTDPIGFKGDASNLYRYCHNDPEDFSDPMGLQENPLGGWENYSGGKPASYEMDAYRNSLITQSLSAGVQRDIANFEKRMNTGQANVKWT